MLPRNCDGRRRPNSLVSVSGADPLNLVGILTPGTRLPALTGNRLLYRDGIPVRPAGRRRGFNFLEPLDDASAWEGAEKRC